jgi:hypothetical protein
MNISLVKQAKKQIYGAQVGQDAQAKVYYISPIMDPVNIDKGRGEMGLAPFSEYIKVWKMKWDDKQYIKDLLAME